MEIPVMFRYFIMAWISIAVIVFFVLFKITAPYGRHTSRNWGKMIANEWGWFIMELPALVMCPLLFLLGNGEKSALSWFFVGLWVLHYGNRTLIFPFRLKTKGKEMPLFIMFSAICFNLVNGFICGYFFGFLSPNYTDAWLTDPRFIVGVFLFFGGVFINWQSDGILLNLRKPGETGYKIPKGGFFKYVSCPNHFGEILEWVGFGIMTWALPTVSFAVWTIANLVPRAVAHHQWYLHTFPDYPKERKAVIPWIW